MEEAEIKPEEARGKEDSLLSSERYELLNNWDTSVRGSDSLGNYKPLCHVTCGPGSVPDWHKNKNPIFAFIGLNKSW